MPTSWCARWRATAKTRKRKRAAFASKVARLLILKDVGAQQNDAGSVSPSSAPTRLSAHLAKPIDMKQLKVMLVKLVN